MPRPKTKVTEQNAEDIYQYFGVFIAEKRNIKSTGDNSYNRSVFTMIYDKESIKTFFDIRKYELDMKTFVLLLQKWIETYVHEKLRKKCFRSLNQKKYADSHKTKVVRISKKTKDAVERLAELKNISWEDAIHEAVSAEYWRIKEVNN